MNTTISKLFSGILTVCHVIALLLVILAIFTGGAAGIMYAIGGLVVYIFLVGIACTILAIRENLEKLAAK